MANSNPNPAPASNQSNSGNQSGLARTLAAIREHVPNVYALIFGLVRVGTVTMGALLVRDMPRPISILLAIGVAGVTLKMERQLAVRLEYPLSPKQSLVGILLCWIPALAVVVTLNSLTAFSVGSDVLQHAHTDAAFQTYWQRQKERADAWVMTFRTAATQATSAAQTDIEAEQARISAARREKTLYSTASLAALRRRLAAARDTVRQAPAIASLPVKAPADAAQGSAQIDRVFRSLTDAYIPVLAVVNVAPPPAPEAFTPPAVDTMTLFISETGSRTPRAIGSWLSAVVLELLGFASIYLGGRRISLADRMRDWRTRTTATRRAAFSTPAARTDAEPLHIVIEPAGVSGTVYLTGLTDRSADELWPPISKAIARHPRIGSHGLNRLCASDGTPVQRDTPLLAQLGGGPLTIVLEAKSEVA